MTTRCAAREPSWLTVFGLSHTALANPVNQQFMGYDMSDYFGAVGYLGASR
jgi:hypothetical protein